MRGPPREKEGSRLNQLIRVRSLTVDTLNGQSRELSDSKRRRRMDILCLQETKWKGSRAKEIGEGLKLFYYELETERNGVAITVGDSISSDVTTIKMFCNRIMAVRVSPEQLRCTVILAYAPQIGYTEVVKDEFYDQ